MRWFYKSEPFDTVPENVVGFVYRITNLTNNKQYIGKKLFTKAKTKQVKGKKKKYRVESDWQNYYGSNKQLQEDIQTQGKENFMREILHLCVSRGNCSYLEAKEQFEHKVLEHPDLFYNDWIMVKTHRRHLKHPLTTSGH
jgi:hypothetical protein